MVYIEIKSMFTNIRILLIKLLYMNHHIDIIISRPKFWLSALAASTKTFNY